MEGFHLFATRTKYESQTYLSIGFFPSFLTHANLGIHTHAFQVIFTTQGTSNTIIMHNYTNLSFHGMTIESFTIDTQLVIRRC